MKRIIFLVTLIFTFSIYAQRLPVLTLNYETGARYQYDLLEEEEQDLLIFDSYNFNAGYIQILQPITKPLNFKFKFNYNLKNYDSASNVLENDTFVYQTGVDWQIIKNLKMELSFKYIKKTYDFASEKSIEGLSPFIEIRYSPVKFMHIGGNYNIIHENYINKERGDNIRNRINLWFEDRIIPKMNLRLRYRLENRDFIINPDKKTKDSFKHSFAATLKIDLNKNSSDKLKIEEEETD